MVFRPICLPQSTPNVTHAFTSGHTLPLVTSHSVPSTPRRTDTANSQILLLGPTRQPDTCSLRLARAFKQLCTHSSSQVLGLVSNLGTIYVFIVFLGIPYYYASQADHVMELAEQNRSAYEEWQAKSTQGSHSPAESPGAPGARTGATELEPAHGEARADSNGIDSSPMPASLSPVHVSWRLYIDARLIEWGYLLKGACIFIASVSPYPLVSG